MPLLPWITSTSVSRSTPALTPSVSASPSSMFRLSEIMLLTSFVTEPLPAPPQYTT